MFSNARSDMRIEQRFGEAIIGSALVFMNQRAWLSTKVLGISVAGAHIHVVYVVIRMRSDTREAVEARHDASMAVLS